MHFTYLFCGSSVSGVGTFKGDSGGLLTGVEGVTTCSGRRMGAGATGSVGELVLNGQLERFVVLSGLKAEILVGLFGDIFGEVLGELEAVNLCRQPSSGARLSWVGLLMNCLSLALTGSTSGRTICSLFSSSLMLDLQEL